MFVCPQLQPTVAEPAESSSQAFLDARPWGHDGYLMCGAIPNDDICENNQQRPPCLTSSCSIRPLQKDDSKWQKPLPALPGLDTPTDSSKRPTSFLNVRPVIEAFTREVDNRFLSPTAELVLRHLKRLSQTPPTSTRVLVQLGTDSIWMTAEDADTLYQLRQITQNLTLEDKTRLLEDLAKVIEPRVKYPLQQVMFHGVQMKSTETPAIRPNPDRQSLLEVILDEGENAEEVRRALRPTPLIIRKAGPVTSHEPHILSPLTELTEPTPRGLIKPDEKIRLLRLRDRQTDQEGSCQEAVEFDGLSSEICEVKSPGSVRSGRLAAEAKREATGETNVVPDALVAPERDQHTRFTLGRHHSFFTHPRKAPHPPTGHAKPAPLQTGRRSPKLPGSVARGHAAAMLTLSARGSPRSPNPSVISSTSSKPGSVRQARERLKDGLKGSVRAALNELESGQRRLPAPPAELAGPHPARSSSLPRTAEDEGSQTGRLERSDSFQFIRPSYAWTKRSRAGVAIKSKAPSDGQGDRSQPNEDAGRPQTIIAVSANVKPSPARALTVNESLHRPYSRHGVLVTKRIDVEPNPSCLRGGAGGSDTGSPQKQYRRKKVSTIFGRVNKLEDHERPHSGLWWLAGGKLGQRKRVPTAAELRERRRVEEANREIVGFWGTVLGSRVVRRLPISAAGDDDSEDGHQDDGDAKDAKADGHNSANDGKKNEPDNTKDSHETREEKADEAGGKKAEEGGREYEHF